MIFRQSVVASLRKTTTDTDQEYSVCNEIRDGSTVVDVARLLLRLTTTASQQHACVCFILRCFCVLYARPLLSLSPPSGRNLMTTVINDPIFSITRLNDRTSEMVIWSVSQRTIYIDSTLYSSLHCGGSFLIKRGSIESSRGRSGISHLR